MVLPSEVTEVMRSSEIEIDSSANGVTRHCIIIAVPKLLFSIIEIIGTIMEH